jgi:hypothetical protein
MSAVIMQRWDAVTPAQYDQIRELVGWDADVPEGMTFHVASFEATSCGCSTSGIPRSNS